MSWDAAEASDVDTVLDWLRELGGDQLAHDWLISCTPYPCALPSKKQLSEGLSVASGEIHIHELMGRIEAEMEREMDAWKASQKA